jgi:hypothetical protein
MRDTIPTSTCSDARIDGLTAGRYRLIVKPQLEKTGTYRLSVFVIPAAQVFDTTLPVNVSDGVPGPGAGSLETKASVDEYRFSVGAGQAIYVDAITCPSMMFLNWELRNANDEVVKAAGACSDARIDGLTAGRYRLLVKPQLEVTGTYALKVSPL